jgi:putative hydrolase of the HAD superfamily
MFNPHPIQAVTFDVGGTLIEPWPSVGHVYAAVAAENGFPGIDPDLLNDQFALAWRAKINFDHSRSAWSDLVAKTFGGLAPSWNEVPFFDQLFERFAQPDVWRIYDDVIPTLAWLVQRGTILAAISNWDERLRPLLKRLTIEGYFQAMVISCEVGAAKPSPVIFQRALQQLRLPAEAVLHIGDSPEEDVQGARAAGLRALQIDRRTKQRGEGRISSLLELKTIVG